MSKIICDICGTSYPETANQCPICGCVRPGDPQHTIADDQNGSGSAGYTQVKGGHFTKGNVKKRTKDTGAKPATRNGDTARGNGQNNDNRGLVIVAIVLLLAVIGVVIYISIHFFGYEMNPSETIQQNVPCTAIVLQQDTLEFTEPGTHHFNVSVKPAECTDEIKIDSEDKSVVTVNGRLITIVGEGTTNLIVTCGNMTARCKVVVAYPEGSDSTENTGATDPSINNGGEDTADFRLLQLTLKLTYKDQKSELYAGSIAKDQIVWGSENAAVAKFENGVVTAVGNGETKVYATYNGKTVYCVVNCNFTENNTGIGGNGGVGEDGGGATYQTGTIINCQENVNVRKGPGTSYDLAGTVNLNETVTIYEKKSDGTYDWARIGDDRWVRMDFIKVN